MTPVGWAAKQRDPLADDLVDDDEARIGKSGFTLNNGGGGNAESDGDDDAESEGE